MLKYLISFILLSQITLASSLQIKNNPTMCGTIADMEQFLKDRNYKEYAIGIGRTDGLPTGDPIYVVMFYQNENKSVVPVMYVVGFDEMCASFIAFDYTEIKEFDIDD